jgi:hypothetical protein
MSECHARGNNAFGSTFIFGLLLIHQICGIEWQGPKQTPGNQQPLMAFGPKPTDPPKLRAAGPLFAQKNSIPRSMLCGYGNADKSMFILSSSSTTALEYFDPLADNCACLGI